ncbi:hypothetical protein OAF27_03150 [Verrucomicrobiales bacterium]|nr:hypothetical protein [Verrucomicrobiales bacterium]
MPSDPSLPPRDPAPPSWDQAEEARKIVDSAPADTSKSARKRKIRKRVKQEETPAWDAQIDRPGKQSTDDVIEQLDETIQQTSARKESGSRRRRQQGVHVREVEYTPGKNFIIAIILLTALGIVAAIGYAVRSKTDAETEAEYVSGDLEGFMEGKTGQQNSGTLESKEPIAATVRPTPIKIDDSRLDAVRECIIGFLAAETIEEKLKFVRQTPEVRVHMEAMEDHPVMRTQIEPTFGAAALAKEGFVYAEVLEAGMGYRGAILELDGETALLDFDSFLGYSDVDWASLESGDDTPETEVRALVALLPPSDQDSPSRRRAIIRDPSQSFTVYTTIEIFSVPERYANLLGTSRQTLPFIVKIQTLQNGSPNASASPEITEIVSAGWFKEVDFITAPDPEDQALPF